MRNLSILSVSFLVLFSRVLNADSTVHLTAPDLSDKNIIGCNVGMRPYRSSGIRIEVEQWQGKTVIHNYGHGGGGISLSPGSAHEAIRLMEARYTPAMKPTIAILGSGVMGLTIANQLLDKGYRVHIYSKNFPPHTTSDVAAGWWSPYGVKAGESEEVKQRFKTIENISYDYFYELATSKTPRFPGVALVDGYYFYRDRAPRTNDPKMTLVNIEFNHGKKMPAESTTHILIETPTYMQALMTQAKSRGAQFIPYTLAHRNDLLALDEEIVFNCMGLGAREIFNDLELKPVRGHLVYFKAQEGVNYMAASYADGVFYTCLFPYKDKLIMGGSYEEDGEQSAVVNITTCKGIIENARNLFNTRKHAREEL